jgi:hypothetical protein
LSGGARLAPKPPDEILFALLGGVLTGAGAAVATGCVVGNIMEIQSIDFSGKLRD